MHSLQSFTPSNGSAMVMGLPQLSQGTSVNLYFSNSSDVNFNSFLNDYTDTEELEPLELDSLELDSLDKENLSVCSYQSKA